MRRKDPVKRAILAGIGCVVAMAAFSIFIQSQVLALNHQSKGLTEKIKTITSDYNMVKAEQDHLEVLQRNTHGLDSLASERFLNGTLLNAMQKVYVENVALIHLHTVHSYNLTEEVRTKTNSITKITKYASSAEKISVVVEAQDSSPNAGDQVATFKEKLSQTQYFTSLLGSNKVMRLVNLSPPQLNQETGRQFVQFTLESAVPEKIRMDIMSPNRYGTAQSVSKSPVKKPETDSLNL